METVIEGIYKEGVIKPLEDVKLEENAKVVITIKDRLYEQSKNEDSLIDLAGVWKNREDIDKRFKEILKERENFGLTGAR